MPEPILVSYITLSSSIEVILSNFICRISFAAFSHLFSSVIFEAYFPGLTAHGVSRQGGAGAGRVHAAHTDTHLEFKLSGGTARTVRDVLQLGLMFTWHPQWFSPFTISQHLKPAVSKLYVFVNMCVCNCVWSRDQHH